MNEYFYEVYVFGPNMEPGYEIETGSINAATREDAEKWVRAEYNVDEIIQLYQIAKGSYV